MPVRSPLIPSTALIRLLLLMEINVPSNIGIAGDSVVTLSFADVHKNVYGAVLSVQILNKVATNIQCSKSVLFL